MTILAQAQLPPLAQPVIIGVAIAYFLGVTLIGAWAARRTRSARDFFVAGGGIGIVALVLTTMSANLSGFAFIGGPGLVYALGMGAVFIVLPAMITGSMSAWVLAKRLRVLAEIRGVMTIPDAIGARYRSPAAQGLSGVAILVAIVGYMATNILALGVVTDAIFGVGLGWGIWIGMGITVAYAAAGGIKAGIYTDVFQGALMSIASLLVFLFAIGAGGGLAEMSRTILANDPGFLEPWGHVGPMTALSFFFVFGIGVLGQPHVIHKFYMLREPRLLKWYPLLATFTLLIGVLLFVGVGIAVKALVAGGEMAPLAAADQATPLFLLHYTPLLLAALVFSGVAAAIMSTVNSFMNVGAAVLTHDLPVAFGRPLRDELLWGRVSTVAISVVAATIAHLSGTLVAFLGIFGWGLFASTLVPALAIGLNWKGATRAGALASIGTGLAFTILFEVLAYAGLYALPAAITISGASLVLSLLVFFAVSWFTRADAPGQIDEDIALVMEV